MNTKNTLALLVVAGACGLTLTLGAQAQTAATPTITGLSPARGVVGQKVIIYGHNFSGLQVVQFNGIAAVGPIVNGMGTEIVTRVPPETTTGPGKVTLTTPGGTATSAMSFTVEATGSSSSPVPSIPAKPRIRMVAPTGGRPGEKVDITGANLRGALWVKFDGLKATFTVPSPTEIIATVPRGAHSGMLSLGTSLGTTAVSFRVI